MKDLILDDIFDETMIKLNDWCSNGRPYGVHVYRGGEVEGDVLGCQLMT